jgi:hypothetical protein
MSRIYSNAVLTIVASSANNTTQGFLSEKSYQQTAFEGLPNTPVSIRGDLHKALGDITGSVRLNTRGWGFQERLLSCRILHFEAKEIIWECRTMQSCECGSELPPLSSQPASLLNAYIFLYEPTSPAKTHAWRRNVIVEQYSALNLTKQTDKLPALSGLAALVREKTQDGYLAGLWLSDLANGLLWELELYGAFDFGPTVLFQLPRSFEQQDTYVPLWSWARTTGQVRYERLP